MEPLRLSPNEAVTLLSGLGAFIWVIKVFCIKWQNERLRQVNKQLRRAVDYGPMTDTAAKGEI